mmetsp:Transcript_25520/g.35181  ORF Transcript_25520/g.35181 Transcript_25520/m.35181 type:complete len:110 (+) Transcript_25520:195-524(+)|eukprot:CAMPEP_0196586956 /NCGR_PEP_ID=MMETSP1081-20130531/55979_1 /TAXON_ID=36882 /ORGANISM="Pyramimonas amylifera, Strain CCMP720" /LENGTH=109 /DNA_ID=CAMNT_0041908985 /DNA_START=181 /DNA_END=510 /DNA_ORIENTATION=+
MPGPGVGAGGRISGYHMLSSAWIERVNSEKRAEMRFKEILRLKDAEYGNADLQKAESERKKTRNELWSKMAAVAVEYESERKLRKEMSNELETLKKTKVFKFASHKEHV